jgi:hypothetical protein
MASRSTLRIVAAAAALSFAASAPAALVSFNVPGWNISYESGTSNPPSNSLAVTDLGSNSLGVSLEKVATFVDNNEAVEIVFTRLAGAGPSKIVFEDETITNFTNTPWTEFAFGLFSAGDVVKFNQAQSAGFNITPFTTRNYLLGGTALQVTGGIVGNGPLSPPWQPGKPGDSTGGQLVIDAPLAAGQSFSFVEGSSLVTVLPEPAGFALAAPLALLLKRRRA